jgi:DNA-binding NarL/FixJ family response regulator
MRPAPKPRAILADDHELVLDGLRRILEPECDIVFVTCDGRRLITAARELDPDLVILDVSMPALNGLEAARQLRNNGSRARLIFVTMHSDADYLRDALAAGASGYVLKMSASKQLVAAVREVAAGRTYIAPQLREMVVPAFNDPEGAKKALQRPLTPRQREVLQLIAEGRSAKEIAATLDISPKTVEFHKTSIFESLGLRTTAELTRYALAHRIIGPI